MAAPTRERRPSADAPHEDTGEPWSRRRVRITLLALVGVAVVGIVLVAVTAVVLVPDSPTRAVAQIGDPSALTEGLFVRATLRTASPESGDLAVQLAFDPSAQLTRDGRLVSPVVVDVNDTRGASPITFATGDTMAKTDVTIVMNGSRVTRYPFDRYDATLVVTARAGTGSAARPIALRVEVVGNLTDFTVKEGSKPASSAGAVVLPVTVRRSIGVLVWALMFLVLIWLIGLGTVSIVFRIVAHATVIPIWSWAVFVSVLFALPQLRSGLPGDPPYGSFVDWAGFYWVVTIVTLGFVTLVIAWNHAERATNASR